MTQYAVKSVTTNSSFSKSNLPLNAISAHCRILLVEDVEILAKAVCFMLNEKVSKIDWVKTAKEAQALLHQNTYELMLLDLELPDMDGLELAKYIRQQPEWDSMRIVVLTAHGDETHMKLARQLGLNGFIRKPITKKICEKLFSQLRSKESQYEFFIG